jgi:hypothetical protein
MLSNIDLSINQIHACSAAVKKTWGIEYGT